MSMIAVTYDAHPAASLFPMLSEPELQELAEDIHKNGLIEPIALFEEMVIDGRNRLAACELAGVEPRFVRLNASLVPSPTIYVMSKNLFRRHLTPSQKAAIAAESVPFLSEEAKKRQGGTTKYGSVPIGTEPEQTAVKGRAREIAAKAAGVGVGSVCRAHAVMKADPARFKEIKEGKVSVNTAYASMSDKVVGKVVGNESLTRKQISERTASRIEQIRELAKAGHRKADIASRLGITITNVSSLATAGNITLPDSFLKSRKLNPSTIVQATVSGADALVAGLDLLDGQYHRLNPQDIGGWIQSLSESVRILNGLIRELRKVGN